MKYPERALIALILLFIQGSPGCSNSEPRSHEVDLSKKRVDHSTKESELVFPDGYPQIKLYQPTWIAEQNEEYPGISWNTNEEVTVVRDYYVQQFKTLGLESVVLKPKNMPGENYVVRIYDPETGVALNTAMGRQSGEGGATCFIYPQKMAEEEWRTRE